MLTTEPKKRPGPVWIKEEAKRRHKAAKAKGLESRHTTWLEIVAEEVGYIDWKDVCEQAALRQALAHLKEDRS